MLKVAFITSCLVVMTTALDNGLGRTPPMGWLSWERFRCNTDCVNDSDNCIGEKLFTTMADLLVKDGYKDVGYEYVNIDDCWLAKTRDSQGRLQPDAKRFPMGMKGLSDYIHSKGLKFGIYEDFGTHTCAGFPGSEYYLQMDAQTFADWGVDFLKLDGCYSDPKQYDDEYPPLAFFLNKTGRPIFLSCEYPLYQQGHGIKPNYPRLAKACNMARNSMDLQDSWSSVLAIITYFADDKYNFSQVAAPGYFNDPDEPDYPKIAKYCNIWRNYGDIDDSWDSVRSIINFYGEDKTKFVEVAGPGNFNDPDMLVIGNFGLSYEQQRVQMALWSIMAAPLLMSVDLRTIRPESRDLLQNKGAIAVNQDPMGKQGTMITKMGNVQVWRRPVLPEGSYAFALLNTGTDGTPKTVSMRLIDLGLDAANGYNVSEVFDNKFEGIFKPNDRFKASVNPTGVYFGKATKLL